MWIFHCLALLEAPTHRRNRCGLPCPLGRVLINYDCSASLAMSALPPKADMCAASWHVRLVPLATERTAANPPARGKPAKLTVRKAGLQD